MVSRSYVPNPSNAIPQPDGVAASGTSPDVSRADHVHALPAAGAVAIGAPVTRTVTVATAYQASTSAKAAFVSVEIECTTTVGIGAPQANTIELVIGATSAVATTGGTRVDVFRQDLSVTLISLGFTGRQVLKACLPAGYYFAVRRPAGSGTTIIASFDQVIG